MQFKLFRNRRKGIIENLGEKGERLAAQFLKKRGYRIIEHNFRLRQGEIDIVAMDKKELVFVEVKARSSLNQEFLMASVNQEKKKRLTRTALYYLRKNNYDGITARFDVVLIIDTDGYRRVELMKNAFRLDELG